MSFPEFMMQHLASDNEKFVDEIMEKVLTIEHKLNKVPFPLTYDKETNS